MAEDSTIGPRQAAAGGRVSGDDAFPRWLEVASDVIERVATRRRARKPQVTPGDVLGADAVALGGAGDPTTGWWLPRPNATTSVLLIHGFGATAADLAPIARHLADRDHAVFLTEQSQLPRPPRSPDEFQRNTPWAGISDAIGWVHGQAEAADGLAIISHSMGAATALAAAVRAPDVVRGVVTLGAIADPRRTRMAGIPAVLNRRASDLMSRMVGRDISADIGVGAMGHVACEVVVIHGTRDRVIPVRNAHLLASASPRARLVLVPGLGHAPAALHAEVSDLVDGYLERWLSTPHSAP